ncbi:hypothetical protein BRDID11002_76450 [Bradyrhizobium diazoefficiens]
MNFRAIVSILFLTSAISAPAFAQQAQPTTPPPGSPAATITIPGNQLPPPDPKFGGVIKDKASESTPWGAAARRAAQGRAERASDHDG